MPLAASSPDVSVARPTRRRWLLAFGAGLLLAAAWGSVAQTQFNLAAITGLGVAVDAATRLRTTLQDLVFFGPIYAGLVLAAWLPAFALAGWVARRYPAGRIGLFAWAAGIGLVVAVRVADAVAPMPVLIYATRTWDGLLWMQLGSMVGGGLFAALTRSASRAAAAGRG